MPVKAILVETGAPAEPTTPYLYFDGTGITISKARWLIEARDSRIDDRIHWGEKHFTLDHGEDSWLEFRVTKIGEDGYVIPVDLIELSISGPSNNAPKSWIDIRSEDGKTLIWKSDFTELLPGNIIRVMFDSSILPRPDIRVKHYMVKFFAWGKDKETGLTSLLSSRFMLRINQ